MANEKTMRLIKQAQDAVSDVIRNEVENRSQNGVTYNADDLSAFVAHELTYNRAKPLEKVQAPLEAFEIFTVSNDIPEGAESAVQKIYSKVGMAKIISDYADDIPCVDVYAEETTVRVKTIATSYRYSIQEILNSAFANIRLTEEKARTAYHYIDTKINDIAWHGDSNYGITGFLDNTYVTVYNVKADGTGSSKKLADKTPIQMFRDVNELIDSVANNTNGYIIPNKVLLDPALYNLLAETIFVDGNGNAKTQTVLDMIKANHPEIKEFKKVYGLRNSGTIIVGNFDSQYVKLEVPKRVAQEPVQRKNLYFNVPVWGRVVGVTIFYPMAFSKATGLA